MNNKNKRNRLIAVLLIVIGVALLGYAAYLHLAPEEEKAGSAGYEKKEMERSEEEGSKILRGLSGSCFSSSEDGITTVVMFSDYDKKERYQRLTTIIISGEEAGAKSEEQYYDISDDGKSIIYDPDSSPMYRDLKIGKNYIIIDEKRFDKDDIDKYTN